jgi:prephenate dehydrogenase
MKLDTSKKILIVGLGLIGGSYAQALTDQGFEVGALVRRPETVAYALAHGLIRHGETEVREDYVGQFDLVVFALYPHVLMDWLEKYQQYLKPGALLTDVTGVKGRVVYAVQNMLRKDVEFIGAHPMAGREVSGVENADKRIFQKANYIVTPTAANTEEAVETCMELGRMLGFARLSKLSPEAHDDMIAFLSQLTHCIAVTLMVCRDTEHMAAYTGDSFRDLTRIARINDEMWSELFMENREALLAQMDLFSEKFASLRDSIDRGDTAAIREMMRLSTKRREYFDK